MGGHEGCEREREGDEGDEGHEDRERVREGDEGDEGHEGHEREREGDEGDEGHEVSWRGVWCMGLAPACGRVHIVVERRPEDAAESLSLRTDSCMLNQECMPI